MRKTIWNGELDQAIRDFRSQGKTWDTIADLIGFDVVQVKRRARDIGVATGRLNHGRITGEQIAAGYPIKPRQEARRRATIKAELPSKYGIKYRLRLGMDPEEARTTPKFMQRNGKRVQPAPELDEAIRQLRDEKKMSWQAIAESVGVGRATVIKRATELGIRVGAKRVEHPMSKGVITPAGRFSSLGESARRLGITRGAAKYRADNGTDGWRYED
jgi:DNA invertase Pin-like site-specific DNA recombinase